MQQGNWSCTVTPMDRLAVKLAQVIFSETPREVDHTSYDVINERKLILIENVDLLTSWWQMFETNRKKRALIR